jgi:hypothetical protein
MGLLAMLLTIMESLVASSGGDVQPGSVVQVKPNSIWFQESETLTRWQALKNAGNPEALKSYEEGALSERLAWQFTNVLSAKILGSDSKSNQVIVEMTAPGRLQGTTWFLDAGALSP